MSELSTVKPDYWVTPVASIGVSPIDHLFRTFDSIYMARWRSNFRNNDDVIGWKSVWTSTFVDEFISPAEVKVGLVACRRATDGWPPNLPQFLGMCRPLLDYEASFREAALQIRLRDDGDDVWSTPAIYWAAIRIGAFDLRQASYPVMKSRWAFAIDRALVDIRAGVLPNEVPVKLLELPSPGRTMSADVVASNLAKIRAMVGFSAKSMRMDRIELEPVVLKVVGGIDHES